MTAPQRAMPPGSHDLGGISYFKPAKERAATTAARPDFTPHMRRAVRRLEGEWKAHGDLWHMFYREQARLAREARRTEFQWLALAEDIERERQRCKAERAAAPPVVVVKRQRLTLNKKAPERCSATGPNSPNPRTT